MAHFLPDTGARERVSGSTVTLEAGQTITLRLWGGYESPSQPLQIRFNRPGVATLQEPSPMGPPQGDRTLAITGQQIGEVRIEAVTRAGVVWDWLLIRIAAATPLGILQRCAEQGRLHFRKPADRRVLAQVAAGEPVLHGLHVSLTPELVAFLNSLLEQGTLDVLSLFRHRESWHGKELHGGVVCGGVDIFGYRGRRLTLRAREQVIQTVVSIIDRIPSNRAAYKIGFPRPRRGWTVDPTDFQPEDDVFFAVPDEAAARLCLSGHAFRRRDQLLEPARAAVVPALRRAEGRGAIFRAMYPDGKDHLCVFAANPADLHAG